MPISTGPAILDMVLKFDLDNTSSESITASPAFIY